MRPKLILTILIVLTIVPFAVWAQGTATVSGTITDEAGDPLPGANVLVQLTNIGAATNVDGQFSFTVPADAVRGQGIKVEARFIGYHTKVQPVTLTPGSHTVNFTLGIDALEMDAIIVTGVVEETPKAKLALSVGHVSKAQIDKVPAISAEQAIRGKVAGVKVVQGSGEPGSSASILLRAPTSINADGRSQQPLYIIDGVIIDPSITASPMADIAAEDIESIEVVKGAAGASLYGSRAANGVINITTSRGKGLALNETRITFRSEYGTNELDQKLPLNKSHHYRVASGSYVDANGINVEPGDLINATGDFVDPRAGTGRVIDTYIGFDQAPIQNQGMIAFADKSFKHKSTGDILLNDDGSLMLENGRPVGLELLTNPVDQMDQFFNPGTFNSTSLTISRNMESTNFSVNFSRRTLSGVLDGLDGSDRKSLRMAIDHRFRKDLTISVSGFFSNLARDDVRQSIGSPFFGLTFMGGEADLTKRHAAVGTKTQAFPDGLPVDVGGELFVQPDPTTDRTNPLYEPENWFRENDQTRVMGGANLSYNPVDWFRLDGNVSYDRSNREVVRWRPIGFQSVLDLATTTRGRIQKIPANDEALNGSVTASLSRSFLNDDLTVRTKVRALFERTEFQDTESRGDGLAVRGVLDLNIADREDLVVNSDLQQVRSEGYSFITGIDLKDRYIFDFLARRDGSSLFGPDERWHNYVRIAGAYRLSEEPWWFTDKIQEFKIRSSYGTAGNRPRFNARFETWTVAAGNVSKLRFGNRDLKPEFAKEFEFGLDMTFLNRFTLELTKASTTVENQLLRVPLASFFGYTEQWQNAGTLETDTWEASLTGLITQSRDVSWTFGANVDRSTNKITKLDVAAYSFQNFGTSQSPQIFRVQEGLEYGAMWGTKHLRDPRDLLVAGVLESELDQFKINDEGYVVWTGIGNEVTEGISKQLWGTESAILGSGQDYDWGMPIRLRDEGNNLIRGQIGSSIPDFNFGVFSTLQWKGFTFYGLVEGQVGGDIYSQTADWGYSENQGRTALSDMAGVPDELKKPTLYNNAVGQGESDTFIFDGTYYKLRELSVKYTFNRNQLSGFFGGLLKNVSVGFVGRNLLTISNYDQGFDPEVGQDGGEAGSAVISKVDGFLYPNFRSYAGTLEFSF